MGAAELIFREEDHTYWLGGVQIPGVTSVLDPYSGLDCVPKHILKRKAWLGTCVHIAAEYHDLGVLDEDSVHSTVAPYLDQYRKFLRESGFLPELIEQKVHHSGLLYAGTLDRTGYLGDQRVLIDLKTSAAVSKTYGPQTAAYQAALKDREGQDHVPIDRRYVLLLGETRYRLIPMNAANDLVIFAAALTLHHGTAAPQTLHRAQATIDQWRKAA